MIKKSKTKILIIWHAAVVKEYQHLIESMAVKYKDIQFYLLTPTAWPEINNKKTNAQIDHQSHFIHITSRTWISGISKHFYPFLGKVLNKIQPDFIDVIEEPSSLVAFQCATYANKHNIPFIFNSAENKPLKKTFLFKKIEQMVFQNAAGAIYRNPITSKILQSRGAKSSHCVIGNGINPKIFKAKKITSKKTTNIVLGFVGKLREEKGILMLVKVFSKIYLKFPQTHLLIIGDGPLYSKLLLIIQEHQLTNEITIFRHVNNKELPKYYQKMDLLIVPSLITSNWEEPFGRVVIEGMACGVPVVGSNSGFIPKLIQNKELIFKAGNEKSLQKKIVNLLGNKRKRMSMGKKNIKKVKSYFWESLGKGRYEYYKEILSRAENAKSAEK